MSVFAEKEGRNKTRICTGILVFMMIGTSLYQTGDILLDSGSVRLYTAENMGTTSSWSKNFIFAENEQEEFGYHDPVAEDGLLWTDYEKKGTNIRITVRNESLEEKCLELPLMGYKGYAVEAVAKEGEEPVVDKTRGAHGDLKISVPGGYEGELTISYKGLWLFTVVEWISILSLIGLCVKEWLVYRKGEKHGIASRQR